MKAAKHLHASEPRPTRKHAEGIRNFLLRGQQSLAIMTAAEEVAHDKAKLPESPALRH